MALYITPRRIVRPILAPLRTLCDSCRTVKMFKGLKGLKCNAFLSNQKQPVVRFRKGNYRSICQSSFPLDRLCAYPRFFPDTGMRQLIDKRVNNSYMALKDGNPSYPGIAKKPIAPFVGNWRLYTQAKKLGSPATVKPCWRGDGKLSAANKRGIDERVKCGFTILITRYPGYPGMSNKPIAPFAEYWRLYAQAKVPDSLAPSKGGSVTASGGGLGRLDAANEKGFFHKINKSRLEQIKKTIKDKPELKKKSKSDEKKEP